MSHATLIEAVPLPMVVIGADGRIGALNVPAESLFGRGMVGRHHVSVLRQPGLLGAIEAARAGGGPGRGRYVSSEGGRETLWRVAASLVGEAVAVSFEDLTALEEAGQMRRDFVANVSHELRTPLTAMTGFIETLRGAAREDAAARERFLAIMAHEAARMNRLVDDLLSLSRVEAEGRALPRGRADLTAVAEAAARGLRERAGAAGRAARTRRAAGAGDGARRR